jgi:hypothetical protein
MAAEPTNQATQPALDGQAQPAASGQPATPEPVAGEDVIALKAQLDALLKHKQALEGDLKKYRDARKEIEDKAAADKAAVEAKLREQGEHLKLYELEKDKRAALEAQLADLTPKAERLTAHEKRVQAKLEAAKAKGDLPSFIVRAIDVAALRDVDEAADILDEYRASQSAAAPAAKQPATPAPAVGGAPSSPAPNKRLEDMTTAELDNLRRTDRAAFDALIGAAPGKQGRTFGGWFAGR